MALETKDKGIIDSTIDKIFLTIFVGERTTDQKNHGRDVNERKPLLVGAV
jgi:hypothetical protein